MILVPNAEMSPNFRCCDRPSRRVDLEAGEYMVKVEVERENYLS